MYLTLHTADTCTQMPTASLCSAGTDTVQPTATLWPFCTSALSLQTQVLTCPLPPSALYIYMQTHAQCHPLDTGMLTHIPTIPSVSCRHLHTHALCLSVLCRHKHSPVNFTSLTSVHTRIHIPNDCLTVQESALTCPLPTSCVVASYTHMPTASLSSA